MMSHLSVFVCSKMIPVVRGHCDLNSLKQRSPNISDLTLLFKKDFCL